MDQSVAVFETMQPQFRPRMITYNITTGAAQVETITAASFAGSAQADFVVVYNQAGVSEALWLDKNAAGTAPTAAEYTAATIKTSVAISTGNTAIQVAAAIAAAKTISDVTFTANGDGTITVTQGIYGACSDAVPKNANGSGAGSISVAVVTNGVDASLGQGKFDGTIAQTAIGVYIITFEKQYARIPEAIVICSTDNKIARISDCTISAVTVETQTVTSGATADSNFSLVVIGSDAKDAIAQG